MGNVRRGDIRTALFAFLLERPGHGYEAMQYLTAQTNGVWRPSAGSIYPALQQLEDEGLVRSGDEDGRRVYQLTAAGRREAKARISERGLPWDHIVELPPDVARLQRAVTELESAAAEVVKLADGTDRVERATRVVRDARRRLYGLLTED